MHAESTVKAPESGSQTSCRVDERSSGYQRTVSVFTHTAARCDDTTLSIGDPIIITLTTKFPTDQVMMLRGSKSGVVLATPSGERPHKNKSSPIPAECHQADPGWHTGVRFGRGRAGRLQPWVLWQD
jgi:hypothetical protein